MVQVADRLRQGETPFSLSATPVFRNSVSTLRRWNKCCWTVFENTMMLSKFTIAHCHFIDDVMTLTAV